MDSTLHHLETMANHWYLQGYHHSRFPRMVRNGFRPSVCTMEAQRFSKEYLEQKAGIRSFRGVKEAPCLWFPFWLPF